MLERLLLRLAPEAGRHLSDEKMADLFCRELAWPESWISRRHLARCESCRFRKENLEGPRADRMLQIYRDSSGEDEEGLSDKPRADFAAWLNLQLRQAATNKRGFPLSRISATRPLLTRSRALSFGLALGVAVASGLYFWSLRRAPRLTAGVLLVRAATWDAPNQAARPGVVHQTLEIRTASETIERSIAWDAQGVRQPKRLAVNRKEERLKSVFDDAGIDWDRPLSASAYRTWHDRQGERTDRIAFAGSHLLTLTTTVAAGAVSEETLTVRAADFHPVRRKVGFRDHKTIEVAELDFKILPWSDMDAAGFEPLGGISRPAAPYAARIPPRLRPEATASADQLDETELTARLILNQLHADAGEQIEIHRSPQQVEVAGLVETDARKRELTAQLATVPRLKVSIQSVVDLASAPASIGESVSVQAASLPDHASALETYLRERGRSLDESNEAARKLFNAVLSVSQESKDLADLKARFPETGRRPVIASATLADLLYSHRERLEAALRKERLLLADAQSAPAFGEASSASIEISLDAAAARNLALLKELTQTNAPAARSAEAILADLSTTVNMLTAAAHDSYGKSQPKTAQSGKN